jgi:hypothetical protein
VVLLIACFTKEAGLAIVTALHDVQWSTIKMDARAAGLM